MNDFVQLHLRIDDEVAHCLYTFPLVHCDYYLKTLLSSLQALSDATDISLSTVLQTLQSAHSPLHYYFPSEHFPLPLFQLQRLPLVQESHLRQNHFLNCHPPHPFLEHS
uniref:Uncharacterized protein n=1 Tax=Salix viminalis TaxID=40686 RepID=A0A6N2KDT5_SALVM